MNNLPQRIRDEDHLEDLLSTPTPEATASLSKMEGDVMILGAGGKMGPTLSRMARRAWNESGISRRVIAVSRFSDASAQMNLLQHGVETISCDLLNRDSLSRLPFVQNIVFMAGQKFGSSGQEPLTWAMNVYLPGMVAEKFKDSRIVAFSTGNVYPFVPPESGGSRETDPVGPVGEYAQSCLGRERMFDFGSMSHGTAGVVFRLNYAVEMRYGVLVDIASKVLQNIPVSLNMAFANVIWQGDANAYALRCFEICESPFKILNITGPEIISIRSIAEQFGALFGKEPILEGEEAKTALLNNASQSFSLFGQPSVSLQQMIEWIADWLKQGKPTWNKPTKFEVRTGKF